MSTCCRVLALLAFAIISLPQSAFAQLINPHVFQSRVDLYPYGSTGVTESCFWKNVVYLSSDSDNNCLYSVDASDPGNLQYISRALDKGGHCNEPMIVDDILYVASWNADIQVFDVSTPGQMNRIGWISAPGEYFWGLDVSNDRVYATQSNNSTTRHLQIIDVSNPSSPSVMKKYGVPERVIGGVAVRGSYAYVANYNHLLVINISDELNPYTAKNMNLGHLLAPVEIRDNYLFVGSEEAEGGLYVFDISDPSDPIQVDNLSGYAARDMYLLGNYAFLAGNGLTTVRISDPTDLRALLATYMRDYTDAVGSYELTVTGNDRHIYVGDLEMYWQTVPPYNNYWKGRTYAFEVLTEDPDDAGPGKWKDFTPAEASWDVQYEADALPTASDPVWTLHEGSESYASVSDGVLRVNDTGTSSGDKVKWLYSWEATNTRGATVLVRARCPSYTPGAPADFPINIMIHDGKYIEEIAILSDQIRSLRTTRQYPLDGTTWHTYRITTQGDQFSVYLDEDPLPVIQAPLTVTRYQDPGAERAMVLFGSGSSASTQDIYFDYVHCYSNGAFGPMTPIADQTPDVSVKVWDIAGKGSMSGITPSTAKVHWSTDGGDTWQSSGGTSWQCQYEGDVLPSAAAPGWTVAEGSEVWASVDSGILRVNDTGTVSGDKIKWSRNWGASPAAGTTVITRARCASHGPDTTYTGNIFIEDGSRREHLKILTDRIVADQSGLTHMLDGTAWHVYRMTTEGTQFKVYVDEDPTPVLQGTMGATTSNNRVMFGSGSSTGTQDIYFDYVRYTSNGALLPGEGGGSGTLWTCLYEGEVIPSVAVPTWTVAEGSEVWASVDSGILHVNDTGTLSGDKIKWSRNWSASPATGTTVIALARCASHGPDTTYTGNIFVEDGSRREFLKILTDRVVASESGLTYMLDGTAWHVYRMTTEGTQFKLYVDEDPTPVLQGTMGTTTSSNRVMFGSGSSTGTQDIYFDYVRYTSDGVLLPGEGDGSGLVTVTCTGQQGTDRSTIVAYGVPFDQYSRTLNKVKFSISDTLGNVGRSPVYNVSIVDYATSISDVKSAPDGTIVSLADKVLYLKETDFAYIEERDRTSGIRLEGTISANQDQLVNVSGSMQTTSWGERYIAVSSVQGTGSREVAPLGVTNVGLGSSLLDGCYVTVWGTVIEGSIWEGFFFISDTYDLSAVVKVKTDGMPDVNEGDFVIVKGAAGLEDWRTIHPIQIIK